MDGNFRTLVVANPQSANGSLGRRWGKLSRIIEQAFGPFEHRFTDAAGDASRIARQAARDDGYEMVVAMGGDGTISEVVDGLFTPEGPVAPDVVLGVLPYGTGGDFRKTVGAPKKLQQGAAQLCGREVQRVDVGRMRYIDNEGRPALRHFLNIASFGIGGLVDQLVNSSTKAFGGRISFALATVRAMRRYKPQMVRVILDGQAPVEAPIHSVAVANGQYFGGGMWIAPEARLDDGLFDVVTLGPLGFADTLRMNRVYKGTHLQMEQVSHARARRVVAEPVDPAEAVLLDVDGETPGQLPATFELLPAALRLKVVEQR